MKKAILGLGLVASGILILSKWIADQGPVCHKHRIAKTLEGEHGKLCCHLCYDDEQLNGE